MSKDVIAAACFPYRKISEVSKLTGISISTVRKLAEEMDMYGERYGKVCIKGEKIRLINIYALYDFIDNIEILRDGNGNLLKPFDVTEYMGGIR